MRYEVTVKLLSHCVTVFWANKSGVLHDGVFPFFFFFFFFYFSLPPPPPPPRLLKEYLGDLGDLILK